MDGISIATFRDVEALNDWYAEHFRVKIISIETLITGKVRVWYIDK